ncbi:methyltransferase domain-containing protein [Aquabacterium fontiphilum]|jgi:SAM-dependent methyltransferase|uniref:methyltransferase domain-containing protein n=1 Tax=Aquabacterium fontiphilum TaxID=450365 RepID=UPI001378BC77|nr:methyltransferase domain-containing protein [Aquabacterium fontiphilum]NBD21966.1 methyltransferase domain-containing protein [Aquabacterium fontiphilum]
MTGPTPAFWQERFETAQTGWDRGAASPQLVAWLDDGTLAPCRIAVPGCGAGWEVAELAARGFDVTGLDYTPAAVARARERLANGGLSARVEQADVLVYQPSAPFDAIYEQTCLCAIHPDHWVQYAAQLHAWLRPGGKLLALLMQRLRPGASEQGLIEGPPYHCDINAVRALFPQSHWVWPKPPYPQVKHPSLSHELAVVLTRR